MIEVRLDIGGRSASLTMRGHAGAAEKGYDIVCAAASILAYTAAQSALRLHAEGKTTEVPVVEMMSGNADIALAVASDARREVQTVFRTIGTGFALLAERYPEYIKLVRREP